MASHLKGVTVQLFSPRWWMQLQWLLAGTIQMGKNPFARSGHMVWNKLHWDASYAVGLPKQRNSCQSSLTFLCLENPTAKFASQCNLFRAMWPDCAKSLLTLNFGEGELKYKKSKGAGLKLLKDPQRATKILLCGRGLKVFSPCKFQNGIVQIPTVDVFTLNTLRGTKTTPSPTPPLPSGQ